MQPETAGIWAKVDFASKPSPVAATGPSQETAPGGLSLGVGKWRWRMLDLCGTVFWLYVILEVFFVDIGTIFGGLGRFRFFILLAAALAFAIVLRKPWAIVGGFGYVIGFPLVVIFWKVPRRFLRMRSATAILATGSVVTSVLGNPKWSLVNLSVTAFAVLAMIVTTSPPVLAVVAVGLFMLLLWAMERTVIMSLKPSRFMRVQQKAIKAVARSHLTLSLTTPDEELRSVDIERFTPDQQNKFLNNLANGVVLHRVLYFWAYQVERYRSGPAPMVLNALTYMWLMARVIVTFTLINVALFTMNASWYEAQAHPSFLTFMRYSISGLYGGEIEALRPRGEIAQAVSVATAIIGLLTIGSLVVSLVIGFRATRDSGDARRTVEEIRNEGRRLDIQLKEHYDVSVNEAVERLEQLKYALMGLIRFFSTRIPDDFENRV